MPPGKEGPQSLFHSPGAKGPVFHGWQGATPGLEAKLSLRSGLLRSPFSPRTSQLGPLGSRCSALHPQAAPVRPVRGFTSWSLVRKGPSPKGNEGLWLGTRAPVPRSLSAQQWKERSWQHRRCRPCQIPCEANPKGHRPHRESQLQVQQQSQAEKPQARGLSGAAPGNRCWGFSVAHPVPVGKQKYAHFHT